MQTEAPSLAPKGILSKMRSLFTFASEKNAAKRLEEEMGRLEQIVSEGRALVSLKDSTGYQLIERQIEALINRHSADLERGSGNDTVLRARIETLRAVLKIVPDAKANAEHAQATLDSLVAKG